MVSAIRSKKTIKLHMHMRGDLKRELTDYSVFNNILTLPTDALLFSLVSESAQGGTLGSRHSCTVDGRPVSPLTAETVTVSEEVGKCRVKTEDTITRRQAPSNNSKPSNC